MSERRTRAFIHHPTPVLIMAVAVFLLSFAARAATLTGLSDLMSRQKVSTAANHEIKFVTPTGVDAPGDTITLTFQTDFDPSSIVFGDVDVAVDTDGTPGDCTGTFTDKTLAASASSGVWGVGVSGLVMTLTPPTDAVGGEVAAASCVRIRIGTNAVVGSTGTHQIVNPSTAVSHDLTIGGGFGDSGVAHLYFDDNDQVTVTATVTGGGGGGGGGGDTCPPTCPAAVISNVHVNNVQETSVDVLWDTDVASTSFVDYGTTVAYGNTTSVGGTAFNHNVHLSSLTPGTLYHYRVRSTASGASESVSGDFTFTTLDTTPPVLSNIQAVDITGTGARITWDSDEDSDSRVDYGTSPGPPYANFASSATLTNAHSLTLTGLTPNTLYRYRVTSKDASTNSTTSVEFTFTTLDTVAPVISSIFVDNISQTGGRVNWTTDELATSRVRYGLTASYTSSASNASLVANHQITITGLAANTLYHYSVSSYDASGNGATSTDQTFTTLADTTPPANVSNFAVTPGDQQNALTWINPADADFAGVKIQRSTTSFPATPTSGTNVYDSTGTSFTDTGLTNGVTYYYTAFAYDTSANFASGAVASGKPFDAVPPGPVTNFVVTAGDTQLALSWNNPADADFSNVQIQRSTTGFPATPAAGTTVYTGAGTSYTDTGLTNGTTYYYTVFAKDTSGNFSTGVNGSGIPTSPTPPPPVCGDSVCTAPEDSASCPADCPATPPPTVCGNSFCESGETTANCPADCPAAPPATVCGNAVCESGENTSNCAVDCPAPPTEPPVEPPPTTTEEHVNADLFRYYTLSRRLELHKDGTGTLRILPGRSLTVIVPVSSLPKEADSLVLNFGNGSYLFSAPQAGDPDGAYETDVSVAQQSGTIEGTIIIQYKDGTSESVVFKIRVENYGAIYATIDGRRTAIEGARVTLYKEINPWIVWDATAYLQTNPVATPADGSFGYMAPQGQYYISVEKDGYRKSDTAPFDVTTEVVNPEIELIPVPKSITEVIVPGAPITENIGNVAKALGAQGAYVTKILQNEVVEDPRVKAATTNYIVPAAAVVTTVVVASAVQITSIISYLYFLLTQPILLLGRRKRKEYGTIYNSLTKRPVDLAIVRLFRTSTGRLVRTLVTDKQGRYAFLVEQGQYRIEASKQGYNFPSQYLKEKKEDAHYLDLYHGEPINVGAQGAIITANIPMDPLDIVKSTRRLYWEEIGRRAQNVLAFSSVIVTFIAALLYRQAFLFVLTIGQLALFLIFRRLARPKQPKNWGIIYNERTKKPIPFAIARIVETQYNKTLESRVTDSKGRYNFLVGSNKYYVTVEKPGFETAKSPEIDLTSSGKDGGVVSADIAIKEKKEAEKKT